MHWSWPNLETFVIGILTYTLFLTIHVQLCRRLSVALYSFIDLIFEALFNFNFNQSIIIQCQLFYLFYQVILYIILYIIVNNYHKWQILEYNRSIFQQKIYNRFIVSGMSYIHLRQNRWSPSSGNEKKECNVGLHSLWRKRAPSGSGLGPAGIVK